MYKPKKFKGLLLVINNDFLVWTGGNLFASDFQNIPRTKWAMVKMVGEKSQW